MATRDRELRNALMEAKTATDILAELSRVEWRREHHHMDCPANRIATPAVPLAVAEIGPGREGMDVDETAAPLRGHLADEIHESLSVVIRDAPNGCRLAFVLHPGASHAAASFRESDAYIVATWPLVSVIKTNGTVERVS